MADLCLQCKMLRVIFFTFSTFSLVFSASDIYLDKELSSLEKTSNYFRYAIENENSLHVLRKRSTEPEPIVPATKYPDVTPTTTTTQTPTKGIKIPLIHSELTDPVKNEKKPYDNKLSLNKNLGVNGTGIRKSITDINKTTNTPVVLNAATTEATIVSEEKLTLMSKNNQTINNDDDSDLTYPTIFDEKYNKTIAEHNITKTSEDHHHFYNSSLTQDPKISVKFWVNMTGNPDAKVSDLLSQSHRRAATVRLSFDFPFYGHLVRNITIATGGFLYTGEFVHSWLAATQYIAPLMANFDTSLSNDSYIKFLDNGTAFTVQWENVSLQDKPKSGNFTFQTTLYKNGDIVFVYENIPMIIEDIQDDHHPVKVGLSDAYISDRTIFFVRRKTIYEYHRVNFNKQDVRNWTSIYLTALPTCLSFKNCSTCVSNFPDLKCMWCPGVNRCSSGMDRKRQGWVSRGCDRLKITDEPSCANADSMDHNFDLTNNNSTDLDPIHYNTALHHNDRESINAPDQPIQQPRITQNEKPVSMGVSSIVTILFLVAFVLFMGLWIVYAYRNPHSTSGQILIRYRPSQWSWKRGEARYTAATIHM